ncbi:MAG: M23 family metallopeptidase [Acidobacteriota bacterium]
MAHRRQGRAKPSVVAVWLGSAVLAGGRAPAPQVTVQHEARAVAPGEVVLVRAETAAAATKVTGTSPSGSVRFFQTDDPLVWEALVGLDLGAPPGTFRISVTAEAENGRAETIHTLTVQPKTFSSRRITVAPEFAAPPRSALARIEREGKRVAAILSDVSPARLWSSPFIAPVPGAVTSAFGHRSIVNGQPRSPHGGVDMRAAEGAPVRAPNRGRVVLSDELYYSGRTVIIDHGLGAFSYMGHLSKRHVAEGDIVERGDLIGLAGSTGRVTGPHLHWTVRLAGARVDPMSLLAVIGERRVPQG